MRQSANLSALDGTRVTLLKRGDICDAELVGSLLREHELGPSFILPRKATWTARSFLRELSFALMSGNFVLLDRTKATGQS